MPGLKGVLGSAKVRSSTAAPGSTQQKRAIVDTLARVIHLIPYDGIGGVEEAARSMQGLETPGIEFHVRYVFPNVTDRSARQSTLNFFKLISAARSILHEEPQVLIVSLWRAAIVGILLRIIAPHIKLVLFIHNSKDAHPVDWFVTQLAIKLCDVIWADSEASISQRFERLPRKPIKVISYLAHQLDPLPLTDVQQAVTFAFWGRLSEQKDVARALHFFAKVRDALPRSNFIIIGPDGGRDLELRALSTELGLSRAVEFLGPLPFERIPRAVADATFYLQTSSYEGMALSVTESMQLGLIPVVTAVGEIGRYCQNGKNAVIIGKDDEVAVSAVVELAADPVARTRLRDAAIATWANKESYAISVLKACYELLDIQEDKSN